MPSEYRRPRKPTQYQAEFARDWGRIYAGLVVFAAIVTFLAWPGWIWRTGTGFWIADGIWWGSLLSLAVFVWWRRHPYVIREYQRNLSSLPFPVRLLAMGVLLATASISIALIATASGGDSNAITLHGTFRDISWVSLNAFPPMTCDIGEANFQSVTVTTGNAPPGNASMSWPVDYPSSVEWGPDASGNINGVWSCLAQWSITVPRSSLGYSLSVPGLSGSIFVPLSEAGGSIPLNDGYAAYPAIPSNLYKG